jgi:WD40 repeat protein
MAVSPDGKTLASVEHAEAGDVVKLWDLAGGKLQHSLPGHSGRIACVTFSPDGKLASVADELIVWDVMTGNARLTHKLGDKSLMPVDGIAVLSRWSNRGTKDNVVLWDVKSENELRTLEGHFDTSTVISPACGTLATNKNYELELVDVASGATRAIPADRLRGYPQILAFTPDGKTLAVAYRRIITVVCLWDVDKCRLLTTLNGLTGDVIAMAVSPDGRTLATSLTDGTVKLWDITKLRGDSTSP